MNFIIIFSWIYKFSRQHLSFSGDKKKELQNHRSSVMSHHLDAKDVAPTEAQERHVQTHYSKINLAHPEAKVCTNMKNHNKL